MEIKIIYGPPGTGKTTTLLNIIEQELKQNDPNKIAYVSFTKKGVYEGKERALNKFNYCSNDFPYFKTLHSIAFKDAGITRSQMISKYNYKQFSEAMGMKFTGYYTEEFFHNDDKYLFFDILQRNNSVIAKNYLYDLDIDILRFVQSNYKIFKKTLKILDFTDLIELFCQKNNSLPVDIAIIDEAQDLTTLQWRMIWIAFRNCKKIYIAGDDDQAIYEWSGADLNHLLNIKGEQMVLNKSYRLPEQVLNYSKKIINLIDKRISKKFKSAHDNGGIHYINSLEELTIDNQKSWLFLSRNNYFLKMIEDYLQNKGIIYYKKGNLSIRPSIIEAIKIYEKIRNNKAGKEVYYKIISYIDVNNCNFEQPWYNEFNLTENEIMYYRDFFASKTDLNNVNIHVNTIHSSKGSEADNVVLLTDITKNVKNNLDMNKDSEIRCYYVGITRTKNNLYILNPQTKNYYDFLNEEFFIKNF